MNTKIDMHNCNFYYFKIAYICIFIFLLYLNVECSILNSVMKALHVRNRTGNNRISECHVKHKPTEQVCVQNQMTVAGLVPQDTV